MVWVLLDWFGLFLKSKTNTTNLLCHQNQLRQCWPIDSRSMPVFWNHQQISERTYSLPPPRPPRDITAQSQPKKRSCTYAGHATHPGEWSSWCWMWGSWGWLLRSSGTWCTCISQFLLEERNRKTNVNEAGATSSASWDSQTRPEEEDMFHVEPDERYSLYWAISLAQNEQSDGTP